MPRGLRHFLESSEPRGSRGWEPHTDAIYGVRGLAAYDRDEAEPIEPESSTFQKSVRNDRIKTGWVSCAAIKHLADRPISKGSPRNVEECVGSRRRKKIRAALLDGTTDVTDSDAGILLADGATGQFIAQD
ncbi:hypothetical protein KM043_014904 [Ampulex compressa]|nr:hypothetical protein KM043_014904 [Ampulex compressa]